MTADSVLEIDTAGLSVCHVVGAAVLEAGPLDTETTFDVVAEGTAVEESVSLRAPENVSTVENKGLSLTIALVDALVECDTEIEDLIVCDTVAVAACLLGDTDEDELTATPVELPRSDEEAEAVRIWVPDSKADRLIRWDADSMLDGEPVEVGEASNVIEFVGDVETVRVMSLGEADTETVEIGLSEDEPKTDGELLVDGEIVRDISALIDCTLEPDVDAHAVRLTERVARTPELVGDIDRDASEDADGVPRGDVVQLGDDESLALPLCEGNAVAVPSSGEWLLETLGDIVCAPVAVCRNDEEDDGEGDISRVERGDNVNAGVEVPAGTDRDAMRGDALTDTDQKPDSVTLAVSE